MNHPVAYAIKKKKQKLSIDNHAQVALNLPCLNLNFSVFDSWYCLSTEKKQKITRVKTQSVNKVLEKSIHSQGSLVKKTKRRDLFIVKPNKLRVHIVSSLSDILICDRAMLTMSQQICVILHFSCNEIDH